VIAEGFDIATEAGLIEAFKQHPLAAWLADLRALDVAVEPAQPMGKVLRHPEVVSQGYVVEIDDPHLGKTIQPNIPFHTDVPLKTGHAAPRLGEGGNADWSGDPAQTGSETNPEHPLQGVRVLDLGMFLAGPMGPSLMGDMGADVIKVEALTGDRIRFMHRYYQCAARSKRSIALDLTRPEAQPILERLVKWAEVLHHNMRPKGADKLGLSEAGVRKYNPDIVYTYVSAYGQRGTQGNWPGYDSIFNAIAGWEFENAGAGNRPVFNRPGTMDILSAHSCLVACMAGLYALRATGKGPGIHSSMLGTSAFAQGEVLIRADGTLTETCHLTSDQTGFGPYHRIYQCSDDSWVALAAHSPYERAALRTLLGNDEAGFEAKARTMTAPDLLGALEGAGVAADAVTFEDAMNRFFDNPRNRELGLVSVVQQSLYGNIEQPGEFWSFGETAMNIARACPTIGQHTDEIMREMDFSDAEIADYRDKKIIG
jgi:crotonobetainyl-CoA:carnitine CoA-transferase CaiB-like acyl-CoA transferase